MIGRDELQKLGYTKKTIKINLNNYIEWENKKKDVRISYIDGNGSVYIRQISDRRPIAISEKELMAILVSIGKAEIVKD